MRERAAKAAGFSMTRCATTSTGGGGTDLGLGLSPSTLKRKCMHIESRTGAVIQYELGIENNPQRKALRQRHPVTTALDVFAALGTIQELVSNETQTYI